ncbi:meiotic recombination protein P22 [Drosophila elegans]|uniref:meiotic recombination protein P22 n=1 Tax=Drosophila elegans TaxID=30023 RepID=UPI0007E66DD6|nr:meiotic recombination protein P22 [Drosophila elegans]
MDRTTSPASTYCSQFSPLRRSQRLIDKENRNLQKIPPKSRSPQLFGETEDDFGELLCQQQKPSSKVLHLRPAEKVVHLKASDKAVSLKPVNKILHLKPSVRISHPKAQDEVKKPADKTLKDQKEVPRKNKQTKRKPGPKPKEPAKKKLTKLQSTFSDDHAGTSPSPSKLPTQYPAHFVHQLPPVEPASSLVPHRPFSAPADQLRELCATPEEGMIPSPLAFGSESSMNLSLSDSIGDIFGTKDIGNILTMALPRQYILVDEHLPAVATMLNVELERLRNVLDITLALSHEQLLTFPIKQEREDLEDQTH